MATQFKVTDDMPPWTCDWCKKSFTYDVAYPLMTFDGGTICFECDEAGYGHEQCDEDNEDPLEGAVEPVGGTPSIDRPLYDQHGMLIGHVPIESLVYDENYDL